MNRALTATYLVAASTIASLHHGQATHGDVTRAPADPLSASSQGTVGASRQKLAAQESGTLRMDAILTANGAIPRYNLGAFVSYSKGRMLASTSGVGSAAHVFARGPDGQWFEEQKLTSPGSHPSFGSPVALSGDTAMVAANGAGQFNVLGTVYVFRRSGSGWNEVQRLTASDAFLGDHFGRRIKLLNGTALIFNSFGTFYEFVDNGSAWSELSRTQASAGSTFNFGISMACDGTTLAVGDSDYRPGSKSTGAAYVYDRIGSSWRERTILLPSNRQHLSQFGSAIAISGNQIVVGAFSLDWLGPPSIFTDNGAIFVFTNRFGAWTETQEIHPSDGGVLDRFGSVVETFRDQLLVGSPGHNGGGSVYSFDREGDLWIERGELSAPRRNTGDNFGTSLSASGGILAVGAPYDDEVGVDTGSVYMFSERPEPLLASVTTRSAPGNSPSYTATPAALGLNWQGVVDTSSTGHSMATIHGYLRPARIAQPNGQTLLLDLTSPVVFRLPLRAGRNGSASWKVAIPRLPALAGITVYTQAIHLSPTLPAALTNAQDLFLGY